MYESEKNFLERIADAVPGLKGYRDKEARRDTDKRLRDYIASEIDRHRKAMDGVKRDLLSGGKLDMLDDADRVGGKLQKCADSIRHAAYGFAGLFDQVKIQEEELDAIYRYDTELLDRVRSGELSAKEAKRRAQQSDAATKRKAIRDVTKVRPEEKRKATRQKLIQRERIRRGDVRMKVRLFNDAREVVIYDVVKGTVGVLTEVEAIERILDYYYEPWPGDPRQKPLPGHLRADEDGLATPGAG